MRRLWLIFAQTVTVAVAICLLYTSDAADERSSVDLGGRRIIKKKKKIPERGKREIADKKTINRHKQNQ